MKFVLIFNLTLLLFVRGAFAEHSDDSRNTLRNLFNVEQIFRRNRPVLNGTQSENFIIYPGQSNADTENLSRVVERMRREAAEKWFPGERVVWNRRAELFLHENEETYARVTRIPVQLSGHSRIATDFLFRRVTTRRIDLPVNNLTWMSHTLPHEITHLVLAGQFGRHTVPRWIDEGIAVLSEPEEELRLQQRRLVRLADRNELFPIRELLQIEDYPETRIPAFYAQSTLLVDFLVKQRGRQDFIAFAREALNTNYETALRRYYGWSMRDLQSEWDQYVRTLN